MPNLNSQQALTMVLAHTTKRASTAMDSITKVAVAITKKQLSTQWRKRLPYLKMNGSIAQFIR